MRNPARRPLLLTAIVVAGCSAGSNPHSLTVGSDGKTGSGGGGGGTINAGDGGVSTPLSAHVESPKGITLTFVTVSCSEQCADVVAVAKGGIPPYHYAWEDASTAQARHLCPTSTTNYQVTVQDTGTSSGEFAEPPQTANAPLTANVISCPAPDAGTDGGAQSSALCIENPSFEGTVTPDQLTAFHAPPWDACYAGGFITYSAIADPTLWQTQGWTFPTASDGKTYLALGQQGPLFGRTSQALCAPILAGESRSFLVDLAIGTSGSADTTNQTLEVLGGSTKCAEPDVLWTSPPLTPKWTTYCVTIRPPHDMTTIGFRPVGPGLEMEGLVDYLVPVPTCG